MTEYNWCHGPNCHKRHTTTRVRGVKGNKVLRTVRIKLNQWNKDHYYQYFCDQTCLHDFINRHFQEFVRLHPRTEPLETPVNITKKTHESPHWGRQTRTEIMIDESRNTG